MTVAAARRHARRRRAECGAAPPPCVDVRVLRLMVMTLRQCIGTFLAVLYGTGVDDPCLGLYNRRARGLQSPVQTFGAGWSSPVARRAHNPKVAGSNPAPATKPSGAPVRAPFVLLATFASVPRCVARVRAPGRSAASARIAVLIGRSHHAPVQAARRGVPRHVLARARRRRQRRARALARRRQHRHPRCRARLRPHGRDGGVRVRPHLRGALQPGRVGRPLARRPLPGREARALHHRPGGRRARRRGGRLRRRQRAGHASRSTPASPRTATATIRRRATRWRRRSSSRSC